MEHNSLATDSIFLPYVDNSGEICGGADQIDIDMYQYA